jgi:lincosamide nucleotidyltransferase A/C/D/E
MGLLSIAGAAYRRVARSRWRALVDVGPVQRLRARLKAVGPAEALALLDALSVAGVRPHVSGGWGVDALLGRQTRRHSDLDIVVRADEDGVDAVLQRLGYRPVPELTRRLEHALMGDRTLLRDRRGHEVDVHRVAPRQWRELEARGAFVRGEIGGRAVSCISAEMQQETHRGYPLTEKDVADLARLRRRLGRDATEHRPR